LADVRTAIHLSLFNDFENMSVFKSLPAQHDRASRYFYC